MAYAISINAAILARTRRGPRPAPQRQISRPADPRNAAHLIGEHNAAENHTASPDGRLEPQAPRSVWQAILRVLVVGAPRFELGTPSPPDWCATRAALRSAGTSGLRRATWVLRAGLAGWPVSGSKSHSRGPGASGNDAMGQAGPDEGGVHSIFRLREITSSS